MKNIQSKKCGLLFILLTLILAVACTFGACAKQEKPSGAKLPPVAEREGYSEEYPTLNGTVRRLPNKKGLSIYGRLFTPKDFDENGSYPILIMSHGNNALSADGNNSVVKNAVANGMIVYSFDFCAASANGKSDGEKNTATNEDESGDLSCVIDFIKTLKFVDKSKMALWGHSRGGAITAMTIGNYINDISAIVLEAPAVRNSSSNGGVNTAEELKKYGKKICFFWGSEDEQLNVSMLTELQEYLGDGMSYTIIEGAMHSFQPSDYRISLPVMNEYLREMGVMSAAE